MSTRPTFAPARTGRAVLAATLIAACTGLAGCTGQYALGRDGVIVDPDPVVVGPAPPPRDGRRAPDRRAARSVDVPPGHLPPPGRCRVWFPDRPPGQQPPPGPCSVRVPPGAVLVRG